MSRRSGRYENHEESDEGWIVSYADLVTLMLGFFILMYKAVANEGTVKKLEKEIGESLLGHKRPVMEHVVTEVSEERKARAFQLLVKMLNLGESDEHAVGTIENKFAQARNAEDLKKIMDKELSPKAKEQAKAFGTSFTRDEMYVRVIVPTDTTFQSGEATLNHASQAHIEDLAKSLIPMGDIVDIEISGYTDDMPTSGNSKWASNWELSSARAAAIGAIFRQVGLPGDKLKISGFAHYRPVVPINGLSGDILKDARAKNRRIEITIKRKNSSPQPGLKTQGLPR